MQMRVFWIAFLIRLFAIALMVGMGTNLQNFSRDSVKYVQTGISIANGISDGHVHWPDFIDNGWYQFIGIVFWVIGPILELIQLFNAFIAAVACAMLCRIAFLVTQDRAVTITSGMTLALFPSFIWYSSLPLKDAVGLLALTSICLGILLILVPKDRNGWHWIALGLLILLAIRIYLVPVCIGCVAVCLLPIRLPQGFQGVMKLAAAVLVFLGGVYLAVDAAGIDVAQNRELFKYFDIDYINNVRVEMNAGKAKMFDYGENNQYGQGIFTDIALFMRGVFFFFFSIDLTNVTRARQLAAVPELLFFLICLPYLVVGVVQGWNRDPKRVLPLILFGVALIFVYGSAATNMGAMYRWRMQAVPFLIVLIMYGALILRRGPVYGILHPLELRPFETRI